MLRRLLASSKSELSTVPHPRHLGLWAGETSSCGEYKSSEDSESKAGAAAWSSRNIGIVAPECAGDTGADGVGSASGGEGRVIHPGGIGTNRFLWHRNLRAMVGVPTTGFSHMTIGSEIPSGRVMDGKARRCIMRCPCICIVNTSVTLLVRCDQKCGQV